eukprot:m.85268 g.85268  ORF g.85268 m.85268 type:complete len:722 (-) comp14718_c0_seq1:81-2246(-)
MADEPVPPTSMNSLGPPADWSHLAHIPPTSIQIPQPVIASTHGDPPPTSLHGFGLRPMPVGAPQATESKAAAAIKDTESSSTSTNATATATDPLATPVATKPKRKRSRGGGLRPCVCSKGVSCLREHLKCGDVSLPRDETRARFWMSILNPALTEADILVWLKRGRSNNARVSKIHFSLDQLQRNAAGNVMVRRNAVPSAEPQWTDAKQLEVLSARLPAHTCICSHDMAICGNVRTVGWARLPHEDLRRTIWLSILIPEPGLRKQFEQHYDRDKHMGCVSHRHFHPSQFKLHGSLGGKKLLDSKMLPRHAPWTQEEVARELSKEELHAHSVAAWQNLDIRTGHMPDSSLMALSQVDSGLPAVEVTYGSHRTGTPPPHLLDQQEQQRQQEQQEQLQHHLQQQHFQQLEHQHQQHQQQQQMVQLQPPPHDSQPSDSHMTLLSTPSNGVQPVLVAHPFDPADPTNNPTPGTDGLLIHATHAQSNMLPDQGLAAFDPNQSYYHHHPAPYAMMPGMLPTTSLYSMVPVSSDGAAAMYYPEGGPLPDGPPGTTPVPSQAGMVAPPQHPHHPVQYVSFLSHLDPSAPHLSHKRGVYMLPTASSANPSLEHDGTSGEPPAKAPHPDNGSEPILMTASMATTGPPPPGNNYATFLPGESGTGQPALRAQDPPGEGQPVSQAMTNPQVPPTSSDSQLQLHSGALGSETSPLAELPSGIDASMTEAVAPSAS